MDTVHARGRVALGQRCVIHWLQLGPMDNLVYLLEDRASGRAGVIDPAWDPAALLELAGQHGLVITDVLLTHSHDDHVNGVDVLLGYGRPLVHLSQAEAAFWPACPAEPVVHADGAKIRVGETELGLVLTPGHSPGSACYALDGHLFTGGTLFVYGCGRCDLPGGDAAAMHASLTRLEARFADDTLILPGHHYGDSMFSTMGEQRQGNPFLHFADAADFIAFRNEHNRHRWPPYRPVPPGAPAW